MVAAQPSYCPSSQPHTKATRRQVAQIFLAVYLGSISVARGPTAQSARLCQRQTTKTLWSATASKQANAATKPELHVIPSNSEGLRYQKFHGFQYLGSWGPYRIRGFDNCSYGSFKKKSDPRNRPRQIGILNRRMQNGTPNSYLQSQVAQNVRPLHPKVAHY